MKKNYVIIGSSAAGIGAAQKIREGDPIGNITCLTTDSEMPYNRCLLADYMAGHRDRPAITIKTQAFFDEKNITLKRNALVTAINSAHQRVLLEDGSNVTYDMLFIGSGRSGWIPELPGKELKGVFHFYSLSDAKNIMAFVEKHGVKKAIVVGAGLSGLECADALTQCGLNVHVIERAPHALPNQLNSDGGALLKKFMQQQGVTLITSNSVHSINGKNGFVADAQLTDGTRLEAEIIIFAIGGRINSDIAQSAELSLFGHGIVVDEYMQTSNPTIFAGGDVCVIPDLLTGHLTQSCLWADAAQQGMTAGMNMTGHERRFPGSLIVTSSHIYGTTFVTSGPVTNPPVNLTKHVKTGTDFYHLYLTENKILKGFAMVGRIDNIGVLRKKLLDKTEFIVPD